MSIKIINDSLLNISRELSSSGAYSVCIEEKWQLDMMAFALLNVITLVVMMILQKKGNYALSDRLINILFLVNVFALTVNVVISMGLKFLPV